MEAICSLGRQGRLSFFGIPERMGAWLLLEKCHNFAAVEAAYVDELLEERNGKKYATGLAVGTQLQESALPPSS